MECRAFLFRALLMWICGSPVAGMTVRSRFASRSGSNFEQKLSWPAKASWTVVHAKKKHSELKSFLDKEREDPSIHEQIHKMGNDLCKHRPDAPGCKEFTKKEQELKEKKEKKEEDKATEAPATKAPATEAPAKKEPATEAPVTEAPAKEEPAEEAPATEAPETKAPATKAPAKEAASDQTEKAQPAKVSGATPTEAAENSRKKPPKLPSQGVEGKKVRHRDGKTMTRDWHDEYEISTTGRPKSGTWSSFSASFVALLSVLAIAV